MDSEIYEKVQSIIKGRRIKAINENERRISEINEKFPQIREINQQIYNTSKELIKIIQSPDKSYVTKRIEQLRKFSIDAQKMVNEVLVNSGYPADYLNMQYICPVCHDTGYCNDNSFCDCFKKLYGSLSASKMNKNAQIKLSNFNTFDLSYYTGENYYLMKKIFEYTKAYAENFSENSENIFMFGGTGLGKTHLSLAIANRVLERGFSVIYDSIINILRKIEHEHFSREHSSDTLDSVLSTDLLILDDLGTEYETSFYNSTIYNIINTRLSNIKPTIISTNYDYNKLKNRYEPRVTSRIISIYKCLEFKGEDIRYQKQKNSSDSETQHK